MLLLLGLVLVLPLGLRELGLRLEVRFCQSLLQSLGGVLGSLLWDLCSGLGSRLQTKSFSSRSWISTLMMGSLPRTRRLHSGSGVSTLDGQSPLQDGCAGRGGTRSLSQDRGWEIFIGLCWHLSPPCKPICLRRRGLPGIATRDLHIQQHVPTPSYGTATHGPAPPPPPRPTRD